MFKSAIRTLLPLIASAVALSASSAASAAQYLFSLTGAQSASFILDSSPTPPYSNQYTFAEYNVAGTYNGSPTVFSALYFSTDAALGGFQAEISGTNYINVSNDHQLFTGTTSDPTFILGTYYLAEAGGPYPYAYTLTITDATSAVPEPATWALMLLGVAGIGLAIPRRAKHSCRTGGSLETRHSALL